MRFPTIIVHRAGGAYAPENTIAALNIGLSYPIDGIEIDVMFTKDHVPIVFHDDSLYRLAGRRKKVWKTSYEMIQSLDVGSSFDSSFQGEGIPSLDEFLSHFDHSKQLYLELKRSDKHLTDVVSILTKHNLLQQTIVLSFSMEILIKLKTFHSGVQTMFLMGSRWRKPLSYSIHPMIDSYGLSYRLAHRNHQLVKELLQRGYPVNIWSCNNMEIALEQIKLGITSITTDVPDQLIETIKNNLPQ